MKGNRFSKIMMAAAILLLAVSAAPWPAAAQNDGRDVVAIFRHMRALSVEGDYDGALAEAQRFEAAIKAQFGVNHPNYAAALNALGICRGQSVFGSKDPLRPICRVLGRVKVHQFGCQLITQSG